MEGFNETYYVTLAEVIPVLFIAAVATRYFTRDQHSETTPVFDMLMLLMILTVIWGRPA